MLHDLIIIGSGPAGYSAAIYAKRAGLNPLLITGTEIGGQLMQTTDVENYPGFTSILGPDLMANMLDHVKSLRVEMTKDFVKQIFKKDGYYELDGISSNYQAKAVIVSTGSSARWLQVAGEDTYKGFGVSACATCDGFFFQDLTVAVVGGGNTAVEEALYLSDIANKVYLIHRRDQLRSEYVLQERLLANPKIEPIWNTTVEEILGSEEPSLQANQLRLKNVKDNSESILHIDGVFVAIGHTPNVECVKALVDLDEYGYIKVYNGGSKCISGGKILEGMFAAGDVKEPNYKQAVVSASSGCIAALDAKAYLDSLK